MNSRADRLGDISLFNSNMEFSIMSGQWQSYIVLADKQLDPVGSRLDFRVRLYVSTPDGRPGSSL